MFNLRVNNINSTSLDMNDVVDVFYFATRFLGGKNNTNTNSSTNDSKTSGTNLFWLILFFLACCCFISCVASCFKCYEDYEDIILRADAVIRMPPVTEGEVVIIDASTSTLTENPSAHYQPVVAVSEVELVDKQNINQV